MDNKKSIGIFDSGFGGLTIMKEIIKELPEYDYVYLGDTARVPYGNRSKEIIYEFTCEAVDFLFAKNCELIILACNSASAEALRKIQQEYLPQKYPGKKVLGVIIPTAELAAIKTQNQKIGIMATEATVKSKTFVQEIQKINSRARVFQKACPLLVPIVEAGEQNKKSTSEILERYLQPLVKKNIDTLILGCTHYGILEKQIKKIVGSKIKIISEAKIIANKLKAYLQNHPEIKLSKKLSANFLLHRCDR